MTTDSSLEIFLRAAGAAFEKDNRDIARQISQALKVPKPLLPRLAPAETSACDILTDLMADAEGELMQQLANCLHELHWRPAGFGKLPSDANRKLAVVELLGPDGMLVTPDIRIGLLIQRSGFHYPKHKHAAEELYLILKGTAHWGTDDAQPAPRAAGSFVHHKSFQPHTMITRSEPMLALWGWTGDISGGSYAV